MKIIFGYITVYRVVKCLIDIKGTRNDKLSCSKTASIWHGLTDKIYTEDDIHHTADVLLLELSSWLLLFYGQFLGRPSELSSVLEEAKFFFIASTIKEGSAIPRPTHPYNKGITLIQARTIKAKPTQMPTDVILSNFNLLFSWSQNSYIRWKIFQLLRYYDRKVETTHFLP